MSCLYCPRCGDLLEEDGGVVGCRRGQMLLSPRMHAELAACFRAETRSPSDARLGFEVGGQWFCPGCGASLQERDPGDLRCDRCGKAINEFVSRLVEHHEHARVTSSAPLGRAEAARLAASWLELQRHWWAHGSVLQLVTDRPADALVAFDAIVVGAESDEVLAELGAGPLEDFVREHGHRFIAELEARTAAEPRWRAAMQGVWLADGDDPLTARLEALGCTQLRNRKAPTAKDAG